MSDTNVMVIRSLDIRKSYVSSLVVTYHSRYNRAFLLLSLDSGYSPW